MDEFDDIPRINAAWQEKLPEGWPTATIMHVMPDGGTIRVDIYGDRAVFYTSRDRIVWVRV